MSMKGSLRSRFQLSRLLHGVSMEVEEILGGRTDDERQAIWDQVYELVQRGCGAYLRLMEETGEFEADENDPAVLFLVSPHGISVVEALSYAIANNGKFTLQQQVDFFACLAEILLWEIPDELRWAQATEKEFESTDPLDMAQVSVHATNAMYAIQEAKQRQVAESIPDYKVAAKVAEVISEKASRNGALAHIEHRAMKAAVFEWCEVNFANFKSMDKAAMAVAGKEVAIEFTTARSWIREWKQKKARSPLG